jgi:hypothetical protein
MSIGMTIHLVMFRMTQRAQHPVKAFSLYMYVCVPSLYALCLSTLFWVHFTFSAAPNCSCLGFLRRNATVWNRCTVNFPCLMKHFTNIASLTVINDFLFHCLWGTSLCNQFKQPFVLWNKTHNKLNEGFLPSYQWLKYIRPPFEDIRYQSFEAMHCFASGFYILGKQYAELLVKMPLHLLLPNRLKLTNINAHSNIERLYIGTSSDMHVIICVFSSRITKYS